ncbi:MAG: C25 family cysteine peptidase [Caldilineaceae bacterium]
MNGQQWIPIKRGAAEGTPADKQVKKSGLGALRDVTLNQSTRGSTRVIYQLNGAWKGAFTAAQTQYDTIAVPRAAVASDEGLPEIPQEGIFVAVPNEVVNIKVKVVRKSTQVLPGVWRLKPAPKSITEREYVEGKEEYKPNPSVYESNREFPGRDFDYLGLKSVEGVPVAHIMIYLAQYLPKPGTLSVVKSMTLEVSYDVPPQRDAIPRARSITPLLGDMILDFENVQQSVIDENGSRSMDRSNAPQAERDAALKRSDIISEYVIVAPQALVAAVQPLLRAKAGWPHYAIVAPTTTISAEFPGTSLKESIRAFLTWAWCNWRVPPRFVVLAGDVDAIPAHPWTSRGTTFASDHYYADILDNLSPEIVVSRIPTSDVVCMQSICQHLAQYTNQRGPDWGGWQNEVALVAYEGSTYKQCSDEISTAISPRFRVTKLYGDSSTRQQVIDKMNAGVLVANYRGHGSKTAWSSANGLATTHINALNNGTMPPMVFNICCENAWIDDQTTEVVVETFVRKDKCVAALGASRDSWTHPNDEFNKYLWQAIMDGEVTPGGIVQRAKALMILNHGADQDYQEEVIMYMLFGDPTAKVISTAEFLRGTWDMDHDGWQGTLVIDRIWNSRVEKVGSCGYPVWSFSGTYTGQDGKQYTMSGKLGGQDPNDLNPGCKRSDHKVTFTIAFPNNNQGFSGYVTTWTRNTMAGYTRWSNKPFAWYAKKR